MFFLVGGYCHNWASGVVLLCHGAHGCLFLSHERCVLVYSCHTNVVCLSVYFCYTTLGGLFLLHWSSSPLTNRNVVGTAEGGFQRV